MPNLNYHYPAMTNAFLFSLQSFTQLHTESFKSSLKRNKPKFALKFQVSSIKLSKKKFNMTEWLISNQLVGYNHAIKLMEAKIQQIYNNLSDELVWLLQHPPLYTAGIGATDDDIIEKLFPIYRTGRGGKYTYHGPGQRIIYLMLNLKKRNKCDIKLYIRDLSNWIINVLKHFNIFGEFKEDRIGIWVNNNGVEEKIAAFGIRLRKWVTYHGIALNVSPNLSHYKGIIPCGLKDYGVTSMEKLGVKVSLGKLDDILKQEFHKIF